MGRRTDHYDADGKPTGSSINRWSTAGKVCLALWITIMWAMFF